MGSKVVVAIKSGTSHRKMSLSIVGEFEADPKEGKISSVSPLGKALLNKKKDDVFEVETPSGTMKYEVVEIK